MGRLRSSRAWLLLILVVAAIGCATPERDRRPLDAQTASYLLSARRAIQQRDFDAATHFVEMAAQSSPELADVYFLQGRILTELERGQLAERAFRRAIALDPGFPGAHFNLGNTYFRRKQYHEALAEYRKEQALQPRPAVELAIARALAKTGAVDSARIAYEEVILEDSTNAEAHARLADLLESVGEPARALVHARRALALDEGDVDFRYLVGSLFLLNDSAGKAEAHLRAVLERDPWHYGAHYTLGQALLRLDRPDEAMPVLAMADSIRALNAEIEHRRALAKMTPARVDAWLDLVDALRRVHRYDEAIEACQIAVHLDPSNPALATNMATLLLEAGDTTRAIAHYRGVVREHPDFADAWLNLGVAHAASGAYDSARSAWERVLEIEPGDAPARTYLAMLPDAN